MAIRQYIGARYVPKYIGHFDSTREYEPLSIVDDANGNSYTSKIPVPAGTSLDDTRYWAPTGNFSGAVTQLQNRMTAAEGDIETLTDNLNTVSTDLASVKSNYKKAYGRNFILIGDSFGIGVNGNDTSEVVSGGGWNRRFKSLFNGHCTVWYPRETEIEATEPFGFTRKSTFLRALQQAAADDSLDNDIITDIIVLGGTNDAINSAAIEDNIALFCSYALSTFKNATVHIGVLSALKNDLKALHTGYSSCIKYGASFIDSTTLLCTIKTYIGTDNVHLSPSGYDAVCPYVYDAILNGNTSFCIPAIMEVTPTSAYTSVRPAESIRLRVDLQPHGWNFKLYGSQSNGTIELFRTMAGQSPTLVGDTLATINDVTLNFPDTEYYISSGNLIIPADTSAPIFAGVVGVAFSSQYSTITIKALNSYTVFGGRQTHVEIPTVNTFIPFSTL